MTNTFEYARKYVTKHGFSLMDPYLPEGKFGKAEIKYVKHPIGTTLDIVGPRMALMGGVRPMKMRLEREWDCMQLFIGGQGPWMSTHPVETFTHIYPAMQAKGDVLVGGLGLGFVLKLLEQNSQVKSVTCVEINKDVVDCTAPHFDNRPLLGGLPVVLEDITTYLKGTTRTFDFIYLDTWCGTGEWEYYKTVLPLKKLCIPRLVKGGTVVCWMEDVMIGQVVRAIMGEAAMGSIPLPLEATSDHESRMAVYKEFSPVTYAFFDKYKIDTVVQMPQDKVNKLAERFANRYWRM